MTTEPTAPPPGYMQDAQGRLVPESMVKDVDKLRDQTVRQIAEQAKGLNAVLQKFKAVAFADIAAFVEASVEQYGVKVSGTKGNVTLTSFDGRYKVQRSVQETLRFDERLRAAKQLIDECISTWAQGSPDELKVLINDAFKVDKEGDVNTNRVLGLKRLAIKDEKWQQAMTAIADSLSVAYSKSYVRVYERVGDTNQYQAISLDVAAV